jgi:hypothetical protein
MNKSIMALLVTLVDTDCEPEISAAKLERFEGLKKIVTVVGVCCMVGKGDGTLFRKMLDSMTSAKEMSAEYDQLTGQLNAIILECSKSGATPMDVENIRMVTTGIAMIDLLFVAMRKEQA